jgi:hypothetical protein
MVRCCSTTWKDGGWRQRATITEMASGGCDVGVLGYCLRRERAAADGAVHSASKKGLNGARGSGGGRRDESAGGWMMMPPRWLPHWRRGKRRTTGKTEVWAGGRY